jgi:hypothetical protein
LAWIVPREAHLRDMSNTRVTCKTCGCPLPQRTGKGRRRVYCSDACRNAAYLRRRADVGRQATSTPQPLDHEYAYEVEKVEPLRPRDRSERDQWLAMGQKFDEIIDSPIVLARFMDELFVRISTHALLEDYRYQRSINELIVIYFHSRPDHQGRPEATGNRVAIGTAAPPARTIPTYSGPRSGTNFRGRIVAVWRTPTRSWRVRTSLRS